MSSSILPIHWYMTHVTDLTQDFLLDIISVYLFFFIRKFVVVHVHRPPLSLDTRPSIVSQKLNWPYVSVRPLIPVSSGLSTRRISVESWVFQNMKENETSSLYVNFFGCFYIFMISYYYQYYENKTISDYIKKVLHRVNSFYGLKVLPVT